ncbi:unnamed protein product, partial [Effrenium voratum]
MQSLPGSRLAIRPLPGAETLSLWVRLPAPSMEGLQLEVAWTEVRLTVGGEKILLPLPAEMVEEVAGEAVAKFSKKSGKLTVTWPRKAAGVKADAPKAAAAEAAAPKEEAAPAEAKAAAPKEEAAPAEVKAAAPKAEAPAEVKPAPETPKAEAKAHGEAYGSIWNKNSWHWEEKNCMDLATAEVRRALAEWKHAPHRAEGQKGRRERWRPLKPGFVSRKPAEDLKTFHSFQSIQSEASTRISRNSSLVDLQEPEAWAGELVALPRVEDVPSPERPLIEEDFVLAWRQMKADLLRDVLPQRLVTPENSCGSTKEGSSIAGTELTPCSIRAPPGLGFDSDEEEEASDVEILLGPTELAAFDSALEGLHLPGGPNDKPVPVRSNAKCLVLTDAMRLAKARSQNAPLSFGSISHLESRQSLRCRP